MNKQLTPQDRQAIDILIERNQSQSGFRSGSTEKSRIEAAEKVLDLIGQLPPEPVPADLVARTMKRIAAAGARPGPVAQGDQAQPPKFTPRGPVS